MKCAWVSTSYHPDPEQALNGARVYGGLLIPEAYNYIQDPRVIEQRALPRPGRGVARSILHRVEGRGGR